MPFSGDRCADTEQTGCQTELKTAGALLQVLWLTAGGSAWSPGIYSQAASLEARHPLSGPTGSQRNPSVFLRLILTSMFA